jgi:thioredoxin-dependent peroxiredoxin
MALQAGDKAPNFKLESDAGRVSKAGLKGKPYIVYFYPKDDTSGCTREAQDFSAAVRKFGKLGVFVLGVSKDSLACHEKFKAKHKLKIALGSDSDIEMAREWDVWGEKSLYGRKYMGMERATFLVDAKGVIARAWHKVKVPGHVADVLEAAKSL